MLRRNETLSDGSFRPTLPVIRSPSARYVDDWETTEGEEEGRQDEGTFPVSSSMIKGGTGGLLKGGSG